MRHSSYRVCFFLLLLCLLGSALFVLLSPVPVQQVTSIATVSGDHKVLLDNLLEGQLVTIKASPSMGDRSIWASRLTAETFSLSPFAYANGQAKYQIDIPGSYSFTIPGAPANTTFSINVWNESGR